MLFLQGRPYPQTIVKKDSEPEFGDRIVKDNQPILEILRASSLMHRASLEAGCYWELARCWVEDGFPASPSHSFNNKM